MRKFFLTAGILALASSNMVITAANKDMKYTVDRFADIEVLRYDVPGFGIYR